jgi:hypothetical protein
MRESKGDSCEMILIFWYFDIGLPVTKLLVPFGGNGKGMIRDSRSYRM